MNFTWQDQPLTVVSIYAPSLAADTQTFFTQSLLPVFPQAGNLLMGGDYNCLACDLDVTLNASGRRRTGYANGLQLVEETLGLNNAWRAQHPSIRAITHTCVSDTSGAKLDRWLVSTVILHYVQSSQILEGLPGDHLGVGIRIRALNVSPKEPKPWSFPLQLLDDSLNQEELIYLVAQTIMDRPVTTTLSHGQRWDDLKRDITDHCSDFSRSSSRQKTAIEAKLRHLASPARHSFTVDPSGPLKLAVWQHYHKALQNHLHEKAQDAAIRAGVLWQQHGEQRTFYFHHLARQRQLCSTIASVVDTQGNTHYAGAHSRWRGPSSRFLIGV